MNKFTPAKIALIVTNIFFIILIIFTVALPWMVTWYAETMRRSANLATTILVTCYPCVPFAGAALLYLRKLLKTAINGEVFSDNSIKYLKNISVCSLIISVITIIAGSFYMPFFLVGATFAFLSLLLFSLKCILKGEK